VSEPGRARGGESMAPLRDGEPMAPTVRRIAGTARRDSRPLELRLARPSDMPACARVWEVSIADYERRLNQPTLPVDLGPTERLIGHIRDTDPKRFWVAVRADGTPDGEIVAFGAANVRGDVWFLSMLFVLPEEQGSGLGRALLARTFPGGTLPAPGVTWTGGEGRPAILGTATDSVQPISNGLYASYGIVPRMPIHRIVGRPRRLDDLPVLPAGIRPVPFDEIAVGLPGDPGHRELVDAVGGLDRGLIGYEHPADHRYLRIEGRTGFLYRGPDGAPIGYGYASPVGRVGPLGALDPDLLAPIAAHLLRAVEPRGASALHVPGAAGPLFRMLLEAGLRLEGFPALLCWTRPFAAFDRYVPISLALI
jgi:GNAT superfamily N-acetyltransferase